MELKKRERKKESGILVKEVHRRKEKTNQSPEGTSEDCLETSAWEHTLNHTHSDLCIC